MNTVTIVGRAGRDASDNFTSFESGKTRASFSVAVGRWDSKTKSEVTDWFNIDAWDRLAEFAAQYIKKGSMLVIDGRIANRRWNDKTTGEERETFYIVANEIRFAGSKKDTEAVL